MRLKDQTQHGEYQNGDSYRGIIPYIHLWVSLDGIVSETVLLRQITSQMKVYGGGTNKVVHDAHLFLGYF